MKKIFVTLAFFSCIAFLSVTLAACANQYYNPNSGICTGYNQSASQKLKEGSVTVSIVCLKTGNGYALQFTFGLDNKAKNQGFQFRNPKDLVDTESYTGSGNITSGLR